MMVKQARKELEVARRLANELRKETQRLRQIIIDAGQDPDLPKVDLQPRNKEIYKSWKDGHGFTEIAKEYKLSPSRISDICRRIDLVLRLKRGPFKDYKDLLPYR